MRNQSEISFELSPFNPILMNLMGMFVSKDELKPALIKVLFDTNGVVATNAHVILHIKGNVNDFGLFNPKTLKLDRSSVFPKYQEFFTKQDFSAEFNTKEFVKAIKEVGGKIKNRVYRKLIISIQNNICTIEHEDYDRGFEVKKEISCVYNQIPIKFGIEYDYFNPYLKAVLSKSPLKNFSLDFKSPKEVFSIETKTVFGQSVFVFLPARYPFEGYDAYEKDFMERKKIFFIKKVYAEESTEKTKKLALLKLKLKLQTQTLILKQQSA